MLTDPMNTSGHDPEGEDLRRRAERDERERKADVDQPRIDEVEPDGIQPIEARCTVMGRVKAPEPVPLVLPSVQPLVEELYDDERQHQLRDEGPLDWPKR